MPTKCDSSCSASGGECRWKTDRRSTRSTLPSSTPRCVLLLCPARGVRSKYKTLLGAYVYCVVGQVRSPATTNRRKLASCGVIVTEMRARDNSQGGTGGQTGCTPVPTDCLLVAPLGKMPPITKYGRSLMTSLRYRTEGSVCMCTSILQVVYCLFVWYVQKKKTFFYQTRVNNYKASTSHVKTFEDEERPLTVPVCPDLDKHISSGPKPLLARIERSSVVFRGRFVLASDTTVGACCGWPADRRDGGGRERVACDRV